MEHYCIRGKLLMKMEHYCIRGKLLMKMEHVRGKLLMNITVLEVNSL